MRLGRLAIAAGGFGRQYQRLAAIGSTVAMGGLVAGVFTWWGLVFGGIGLITGGMCEWLRWREMKRSLRAHGVEFCLKCGYSRKTLDDARPCPECGSGYNRADNEYVLQFWGIERPGAAGRVTK